MEIDKKEIKRFINKELTQTQTHIEKLKELTKPIEPDCAIGRVSRMDAINNKAINDVALQQSKLKLAALKNALERIDDKNFGICARCKNPIPVGRIMLMPHSQLCAMCVD